MNARGEEDSIRMKSGTTYSLVTKVRLQIILGGLPCDILHNSAVHLQVGLLPERKEAKNTKGGSKWVFPGLWRFV